MFAHIDADSFFASVLTRQDPRLRGKPFLALGMGGGCVISASYEAKAKGVKTGMRLKEALALVPDALHLPSDFQETGLASQQIETILRSLCPRIEQMSIDEWYLDLRTMMGGIPVDLHSWATQTRRRVLDETALSVSVGSAPTKLLAKMASEYRKPGGVTVVANIPIGTFSPPPPEEGSGVEETTNNTLDIQSFLLQRPAPAIPGIGPRRMVRAEAEGWKTAWDIATADPERLVALFGRPGLEMQRELLGESLFEVANEEVAPKSISRCRSFRREADARILWAHLLRHAEYLILKLRREHLICRGISVWLRDDRYDHRSNHLKLSQPTDTEEALQPYLHRALRSLYHSGQSYTQVGLAIWRLAPKGALQYSLFEAPERTIRGDKLQESLDALHERHGRNAITRGASLAVKSGTKKGLDLSVYDAH